MILNMLLSINKAAWILHLKLLICLMIIHLYYCMFFWPGALWFSFKVVQCYVLDSIWKLCYIKECKRQHLPFQHLCIPFHSRNGREICVCTVLHIHISSHSRELFWNQFWSIAQPYLILVLYGKNVTVAGDLPYGVVAKAFRVAKCFPRGYVKVGAKLF